MLKPISNVALNISPSTTLEIDAMYKQMLKDGMDVVGFGAGEPDFPTPKNISDAGIAAIHSNFTKYTPTGGIMPLRQAVAKRIYDDIGVKYEPNQVVVASGAKHSVYAALMTIINPGDEVILLAPYWISYYEMIRQAHGIPVILNASQDNDFKVSAEQIEDSSNCKTKAIILNSPCNPTGMIYTRDELLKIEQVCSRHNLYVISDEIYYKLVYSGNEFCSIASLGDEINKRTIMINGVSKSYSMTGWRIGYAVANSQIAKAMTNYLSHSTSAPSTISQYAALEALTSRQDEINNMVDEFERRRNVLCARINEIGRVSCIMPQGAFYVMMNIKEILGKTLYGVKIETDEDFSKLFLEKGLVATVPCTGFGAPGFVRFSYANSMENINKGMDRLQDFINDAF